MMRDFFKSQVAADARMLEPITTTIYQLAERWSLTPQQIIEAAIAGQISLYFRLGNCVIADLPNPTPGDFRRRSYQGYLRADKTTLESILNDGEARHVQEAYLPDGKRVYVELPPYEVAPTVGGVAMPIQMATPLTIRIEGLCAFMDEVKAHEKAPPVPTMGMDGDTRPIVQPESWTAQSLHGLQRCDGTADGRLVRLADVVAWLMQARELPCLNAVELVCTALAQSLSTANALYLLSENGYADVLKATHSFFYLPIMVVGEDYPEGTAEDKGLAGALKYMRSFWGESSAPGAENWCGQHVLDPLAVRLSLAYRLWGYGRRGDNVAKLTTDTDLPAPVETVEVTPASEPLNVIKKEGWICKKAALIKANATTWPTIEADFNHASENGLSSAAKAPGHGNWFETAALAWAKQRGKITEPNGATPIVNSVFAMAGTVHTTK